jgi:triacylglycerol lipase
MSMLRVGRHAVVLLLAGLVLALTAAPASAAEPVVNPGVNDFSCKPPPKHRYPVVIVHGTFLEQQTTVLRIAPVLKRLGYCVFSLDYGNNATGDIPTSARQVSAFIDRVLKATGADRVSIVGHSQGGMLPRYIIKNLGGGSKIDDLVGLAPSNHGTTTPLVDVVSPACPACAQQKAGSPFLISLNAGNETPGPVSYTAVETKNDEVVTPYTSAFLPRTKDGRVTNVLLQDQCPADVTEHVAIIYDNVAMEWMLNALGRRGPADPNFRADCSGALADTYPQTDSGVVSAAKRSGACPTVHRSTRRKSGYRRATGLKRRRVGCVRARRVAWGWLRRSGNPIRFGHWKCRRSGRKAVHVLCTERAGKRVRFQARRR